MQLQHKVGHPHTPALTTFNSRLPIQAEAAAKLAEEQEKKRKKEAEKMAAKTAEEGAAVETEIVAGQEVMTQIEQ